MLIFSHVFAALAMKAICSDILWSSHRMDPAIPPIPLKFGLDVETDGITHTYPNGARGVCCLQNEAFWREQGRLPSWTENGLREQEMETGSRLIIIGWRLSKGNMHAGWVSLCSTDSWCFVRSGPKISLPVYFTDL